MEITSWKGLKVLVIEDSKEERRVICDMLHEIGVTHTFEVEDGWTALEFKSSDFELADIVMCDWNMKGLNGLEVLKHFRETSTDQAFLMVSGRCDPESIMHAKAAGADGYLLKPFSCNELQTKIAAVMMQKHSL